MPVEIPAGFAQCTYVWQYQGSTHESVNVLGHAIAPTDASTPDQIAQTLFDRWLGALRTLQKSVIFFLRTEVLIGTSSFPLTGTAGVATPGLAGGSPLTSNTPLLVSKNTATGGRPNKGRMFLPGMVSEDNVGTTGIITTSFIGPLQTALDQWRANLVGAFPPNVQTYPPYILHSSEGAGSGLPPTAITGFGLQSIVATQRRRMRS